MSSSYPSFSLSRRKQTSGYLHGKIKSCPETITGYRSHFLKQLSESGHRMRLFTMEEERQDFIPDSNPDSMPDSQPEEVILITRKSVNLFKDIMIQSEVKYNIYYSQIQIEGVESDNHGIKLVFNLDERVKERLDEFKISYHTPSTLLPYLCNLVKASLTGTREEALEILELPTAKNHQVINNYYINMKPQCKARVANLVKLTSWIPSFNIDSAYTAIQVMLDLKRETLDKINNEKKEREAKWNQLLKVIPTQKKDNMKKKEKKRKSRSKKQHNEKPLASKKQKKSHNKEDQGDETEEESVMINFLDMALEGRQEILGDDIPCPV